MFRPPLRVSQLFKENRALLIVLAFCTVLFLVNSGRFFRPEIFSTASALEFGMAPGFLVIAHDSYELGRYVQHLPDGTVTPEIRREPLYPALVVAAGYFLKDFSWLIALQVAMLFIAYLALGLFVYRRFGLASFVMMSGLFLFSPMSFFYAQTFYAYAVHLAVAVVAVILLVRGIEKDSAAALSISGVLWGLVSYERGLFLLFPFFVVLALVFLVRVGFFKIRMPSRSLALFIVAFVVTVSPWLIRNSFHGVISMNGMMGYTLGYTYGNLASPESLADEHEGFDGFMKKYGSDSGSSFWIEHLMISERLSYAEADKRTVRIMLGKMTNEPRKVAAVILQNLKRFPTRLAPNLTAMTFGRRAESLTSYYSAYVSGVAATAWDYLIFGLGVWGLVECLRRRDVLAVVSASALAYLVLVNVVMVIFDPRYRDFLDLLIYAFVFLGLKAAWSAGKRGLEIGKRLYF